MILEPGNHKRQMNFNTIVLTIGFAFTGFLGRELYAEMRSTHDAIIILQSTTSLQISELKERIIEIEKRLQNLEERKLKP